MASRSQCPYLSFSQAHVSGLSFIPGAPDVEVPEFEASAAQRLDLKHKWTLWEQITGSNRDNWSVKQVVSFATVQEFWSVWTGIPQPSELLDGKKFTRKAEDDKEEKPIEAFMIFREDVKPEWEDTANSKGGHFQLTLKMTTSGQQVDEYWNNIVLGMVGNTIEACDRVTGVRLVDKLSVKAKVTDHIRIELWYHSDTTDQEVQKLKSSMESILITRLDGTKGPAIRSDSIIDKKHSNQLVSK